MEPMKLEGALTNDIHRALKRAVEDMQLGVTVTDTSGRILFTNSAEALMHGYSVEELVGKDARILAPQQYRRLMTREELGRVKSWVREGVNVRKDGSIFPVKLMSDVVTDEQGVPAVIITTCEDITQRKLEEEELRVYREYLQKLVDDRTKELSDTAEKLKLYSRALEEAIDGIQIVDLEGHIVYSNKSVEDIYGFSVEELLGKHVNEMNVDKNFASTTILPAVRVAGRWNGELMASHKSGREFPVWLSASLVRNAEGEPVGMVGIMRDITEREMIAEEREKMIAELQEALANIKTLRGLLPMCASCKKVRDDKGYWKQIEAYIRDHTDADFSHSICPDCKRKFYPGY